MSHDKVISVERVIPADPQAIFDVLADPAMHAVIDGSSSVRDTRPGSPARLSQGAKFSMNMTIGLPYRITNTVVEFEEGRRIGWRHFGGHIWRYVLDPVEGGTKVTEQFDYRGSRSTRAIELIRAPERNRESMVKTLERLEAHITGKAGA